MTTNSIIAELWADNGPEVYELIDLLQRQGWEVKHIFSAASVPVLKIGNNCISGLGNIKSVFFAVEESA